MLIDNVCTIIGWRVYIVPRKYKCGLAYEKLHIKTKGLKETFSKRYTPKWTARLMWGRLQMKQTHPVMEVCGDCQHWLTARYWWRRLVDWDVTNNQGWDKYNKELAIINVQDHNCDRQTPCEKEVELWDECLLCGIWCWAACCCVVVEAGHLACAIRNPKCMKL